MKYLGKIVNWVMEAKQQVVGRGVWSVEVGC